MFGGILNVNTVDGKITRDTHNTYTISTQKIRPAHIIHIANRMENKPKPMKMLLDTLAERQSERGRLK